MTDEENDGMMPSMADCSYCKGVGACPKCWGRAAIELLKGSLNEVRTRKLALFNKVCESAVMIIDLREALLEIRDIRQERSQQSPTEILEVVQAIAASALHKNDQEGRP